MPMLSVIICTHNPRVDYLERTLEALKAQTLPLDEWELLLIDNASKEPLANEWDLSWHLNAQKIREETLGLTAARLRGIRESKGDLLVFVDDDNILATNYLDNTLEISANYPNIGVWGGNVRLEYEEQPNSQLELFCSLLALKEVDLPLWSNLYTYETAPVGAGFCIRKIVAQEYSKALINTDSRIKLGRIGTGFGGCEDLDICWTAVDCGLGHGVFPNLQCTHLIAKHRVELNYLLKIQKGTWGSYVILRHTRSMPIWDIYPLWSMKKKIRENLGLLRINKLQKSFIRARWEGEQEAYQLILGQ